MAIFDSLRDQRWKKSIENVRFLRLRGQDMHPRGGPKSCFNNLLMRRVGSRDSTMIEACPDLSIAPVVVLLLQSADAALAPEKSAKRLIAQAIVLLNQRLAETALRSGGPSSNGLAPWQARRVSEYIDKHPASPLPVAKLAVVNLGTWYFGHAFKKHLGVSPHSYVMHKQLKRLKSLCWLPMSRWPKFHCCAD